MNNCISTPASLTVLFILLLLAPAVAQGGAPEHHDRDLDELLDALTSARVGASSGFAPVDLDRLAFDQDVRLDLEFEPPSRAASPVVKRALLSPSTALLEDAAGGPAGGQDAGGATASGGKSADEVARQLANPNSDLAQLKFKNQFYLYDGDLPNADDQWSYTLLFQPSFPFSLGETENGGKQVLFVRPAIPLLVEQPTFDTGSLDFAGATGIGDVGFDLAYGVTEKSGFLWAAGMNGTLPTSTDERFAGKHFSIGPELLLASFADWGVVGALSTHQWDVAGWGEGHVSRTTLQPIFSYLPGGGWSIGSQGTIAYDWESDSWTVPLNLVIGKTLAIGEQVVKVELDFSYYVERPDAFGPEWLFGFNVTPVVPNFIENMIKGK